MCLSALSPTMERKTAPSGLSKSKIVKCLTKKIQGGTSGTTGSRAEIREQPISLTQGLALHLNPMDQDGEGGYSPKGRCLA